MTSQFGIGSGIIINKDGKQSSQTDIIIYDNRVLPPFIKEQHIGVYPAESVVATIEIKSNLTKGEIIKSEKSAKRLHEVIYDRNTILFMDAGNFNELRPLCSIIGFYGDGIKELLKDDVGEKWLDDNIEYLIAICFSNKYSWIKVRNKWALRRYDENTSEEIKRFIAVIIDNIRTISEMRLEILRQYHRDWLGAYIRDF